MRKVFAILLLTLLCFNLLGYELFFYFRMKEAKQEMKTYLRTAPPHQAITRFTFSASETASIQWEDDEEFIWKGVMYDVIEKEQHGASLEIRCVPDKKESGLLHAFLKTTKKSRDNKQLALSKMLSASFLLPQENNTINFSQFKKAFYSEPLFTIPYPELSIQSPPPQQLPC